MLSDHMVVEEWSQRRRRFSAPGSQEDFSDQTNAINTNKWIKKKAKFGKKDDGGNPGLNQQTKVDAAGRSDDVLPQ